MDPTRTQADRAALVQEAESLLTAGRGRDAVARLTQAVEDHPDPALEAFLVRVRHRAAVAAADPDRPVEEGWPKSRPDPFTAPGVPEITCSELTADILGGALEHRGCLLVRGLFSVETAELLLEDAHRSLAAAEHAPLDGSGPDDDPWYSPFEATEGFSFGGIERYFTQTIGGVLTVEAPRPLRHVIEAFRAVGFGEILAEYLGEWPMLSAKKSTLRRATPTSPTEWHQDGAFLGTQSRTVNAWVALTPCGVDAPGIDVFPQAFDHIVETGTDSALFDWSVSPEQADRVASGLVSPVFGAGDALLFNQMTLHRSSISPSMTQDRYAVESWFFAPSRFPYEQVPILF